MKELNNLIVTLCLIAGLAFIGMKYLDGKLPTLPSLSLKPKTEVTTDLSKLSAAFQSRQGLTAGETHYASIDIKIDESLLGLPPTLAGNCARLKNGQGKVSYSSDFAKLPPSVIPTPTGVEIQLPEPTPSSVTITKFPDIKAKRACGILHPAPTNEQKFNRELLTQLCDLARNDTSQLELRRKDVQAGAEAMARAVGVYNAHVAFQPVNTNLPHECDGIKKGDN